MSCIEHLNNTVVCRAATRAWVYLRAALCILPIYSTSFQYENTPWASTAHYSQVLLSLCPGINNSMKANANAEWICLTHCYWTGKVLKTQSTRSKAFLLTLFMHCSIQFYAFFFFFNEQAQGHTGDWVMVLFVQNSTWEIFFVCFFPIAM